MTLDAGFGCTTFKSATAQEPGMCKRSRGCVHSEKGTRGEDKRQKMLIKTRVSDFAEYQNERQEY